VARARRIAKRVLAAIGAIAVVLGMVACVTTDRFRAFGGSPNDATLARMHASKQFATGEWKNAEPTELMKVGYWESAKHWSQSGGDREPRCALPVVRPDLSRAPPSGLRVTWLGHSTTLVEIDGFVVLTDPNWSERSSPSTIVGPRRFHPPPIAIADLPKVDAVVISHEHFDHLDMASVRALAARGLAFHVPLGMAAHLTTFGVPDAQITEHDWWESARIGDLTIVATPARHFNGRGPPWRPGALWASWSIASPKHRVFFSGDTGLTDQLRTIAEREGPFDLAMLEIGQYHPDWGDIHLGPRGALDALAMLGAKHLLPIHWGTFSLAYHAWSEPAETLLAEGTTRGAPLVMPRLGEPVEPSEPRVTPWWREARCP
jgi:L-ascorbate metabolism protein UlaG (beta-lactamase superfamily)